MKKTNLFKSLIIAILLSNGIAVMAMEQQNKVFEGIINNTKQKQDFIIGRVKNPILMGEIKPGTAKLKKVTLQPDSTYTISEDIGHLTVTPIKPINNNFIILIEPSFDDEGAKIKEIKVVE